MYKNAIQRLKQSTSEFWFFFPLNTLHVSVKKKTHALNIK